MTGEIKADKLNGFTTPDSQESPLTISQLLDQKVRGPLRTELTLPELTENETSVILYVGEDGVPVFDNTPEIEGLNWVMINAKLRGVHPANPTTKIKGD